jgi:hypothetical protein
MNGIDDFVALPALNVSGSAITLAAWVRTSSFPADVWQRFIAKAIDATEQRTTWMLGHAVVNGQNRLRFQLKAGGITTSLTATNGSLPLNTWYHVAATYDGSRMRLYLNGAEVGSIAKTGSLSQDSGVPVNLGRSPDGVRYMQGALDDVRIYSSALSQAAIATLATASASTNQPPTVSLSSPSSGATYPMGSTIPITASAADADGSTTRVEFYAGSTLIGTDTSSPYSASWPNVPAGSYSLTALAWDNAGASTRSAARTVTVSSLTSPNPSPALVSHWMLNEGSGTVTMDAAASRSGSLRNGATWTTGRSGSAVRMDGVDDFVALPTLDVTGSAITLAAWVRNSSFPGGVWQRFIAKAIDSTEQRTTWVLGHVVVNGQNRLRFQLKAGGVTTSLTAPTGTLPVNTWYHAAATYDGSRMRLYLNGTEIGSVAKTGLLSQDSASPVNLGRSPDGSRYMQGDLDDVRIYRSVLTPNDIVALATSGTLPSGNQAPTVSLSSPANGTGYPVASTIPVQATAADADGSITRVEFYAGSTLIGTDTSSPYGVSWPNVAAGSYSLTALAWDNAGASTRSAARTVTVSSSSSSNQPPSVSLTSPTSGSAFNAPASITLSATASDADGTVARVEFYSGTTLIGTDSSSPYSMTWGNVASGAYALTAVARDNAGATTVSSTRDIIVMPQNLLRTAIFTPPSNHSTAVTHYVLEVFPAGTNVTVANPVATRDLGKPAITNGQCTVDVASTILGLAPGTYVATVTAVGNSGSSQSAPSPQFTR